MKCVFIKCYHFDIYNFFLAFVVPSLANMFANNLIPNVPNSIFRRSQQVSFIFFYQYIGENPLVNRCFIFFYSNFNILRNVDKANDLSIDFVLVQLLLVGTYFQKLIFLIINLKFVIT